MEELRAKLAKQASKAGSQVLKRFGRDKRGSTAVEFSMLILPFTLLLFALIETGISFAGEQVISNATDDLARDMRTGELKPEDITAGSVFNRICDHIDLFVSPGCPELVIDLQTYPSFSAVPTQIAYLPNGDIDTSGFGTHLGGSGSINSLRVFYRWPIMTDFMRKYLSTLPNGKTLLFSTLTWQVEPYL